MKNFSFSLLYFLTLFSSITVCILFSEHLTELVNEVKKIMKKSVENVKLGKVQSNVRAKVESLTVNAGKHYIYSCMTYFETLVFYVLTFHFNFLFIHFFIINFVLKYFLHFIGPANVFFFFYHLLLKNASLFFLFLLYFLTLFSSITVCTIFVNHYLFFSIYLFFFF